MSTHDAEYFRQRRRAQGLPARDPFSAVRFQQRATELARPEQLPWPRNLFGELASIAELMAESAQPRVGEHRCRMLVQMPQRVQAQRAHNIPVQMSRPH